MSAASPPSPAPPLWYGSFVDWLRRHSGISLRQDQHFFGESRLGVLARRLGYDDIEALLGDLFRGDREVEAAVLDAFTTNETYFFRDGHPFEVLASRLLPSLVEARQDVRRLRIWSAACSTGQEPYSIAMILRERFASAVAGWSVDIVATDISVRALEIAKKGEYPRHSAFRGLPPRYHRYVRERGSRYVVDPAIRRMVTFRRGNLVTGDHPGGPFDLVLLRNVLIYFDREVRERVLSDVHDLLEPDGLLMLGGAEVADPVVRARFDLCREGRTHWHRRRS